MMLLIQILNFMWIKAMFLGILKGHDNCILNFCWDFKWFYRKFFTVLFSKLVSLPASRAMYV